MEFIFLAYYQRKTYGFLIYISWGVISQYIFKVYFIHVNHRFQIKIKFLTPTILFNFLNSHFRIFFNLLKKQMNPNTLFFTLIPERSTSWPSVKTARKVPFHSSHSNGNTLSQLSPFQQTFLGPIHLTFYYLFSIAFVCCW